MSSPNFTLADVLARIEKVPVGFYTLPEMFGSDWESGRRPRNLGKLFRRAVRNGTVPRVRWIRKRSDRLHEYEVFTIVPPIQTDDM